MTNSKDLEENHDPAEYPCFTRRGLNMSYGLAAIAWCLLIGAVIAYL